jgi:hypothetical protein
MSDNKKEHKEVKKSARESHLFKRWEDPAQNKMGNDVSSEIKIANSNGISEGGYDKRWHIKEE